MKIYKELNLEERPKTYYDLLVDELGENENICPIYTRKHLSVSECYGEDHEGKKWNDKVDFNLKFNN